MGNETYEPWCAIHQTNHEYGIDCRFTNQPNPEPQPTGGVEERVILIMEGHRRNPTMKAWELDMLALLAAERTKAIEEFAEYCHDYYTGCTQLSSGQYDYGYTTEVVMMARKYIAQLSKEAK